MKLRFRTQCFCLRSPMSPCVSYHLLTPVIQGNHRPCDFGSHIVQATRDGHAPDGLTPTARCRTPHLGKASSRPHPSGPAIARLRSLRQPRSGRAGALLKFRASTGLRKPRTTLPLHNKRIWGVTSRQLLVNSASRQ